MSEATIRLNDPVLYALERFEEDGFTYGDVIPRAWFDECFGIEQPKTVAEAYDAQVLYMNLMGALRKRLLNDRKMALRSKPGVGQEVVRPSEQTAWAVTEFRGALALAVEKTRDRLKNIDLQALTEDEKRANADAIAKLSFFARKSSRALP
jgi:hypothetical protein